MAIYDLFDYIIKLNPQAAKSFDEQRTSLLVYLTLTQVGFTGLVFIFSIFVSHKIAGPMFKLTNYLQGIRNGEEIGALAFRDGDQFTEIADEINQTIQYLTNKSESESEYLQEISAYIENIALVVPEDKKPVLDEIQRKLALFSK
jgi:methyl-accepting chemotaxis protein